jgi:hypothetical protein
MVNNPDPDRPGYQIGQPDYEEWMEDYHSRLDSKTSFVMDYTMSSDFLYRKCYSPMIAAALTKRMVK